MSTSASTSATTAPTPGAPTLKESGPALMRTPKGMRLGIGLFGRRNVGKSSVLNAITHQQTSIVSDVAGTTTDPVDKPMELLPLGPVLFIDTAGIDDDQDTIGALRTQKTARVFDRCDLGVVVTEAGVWGPYEDEIVAQLESRDIPLIIVFNKIDALAGASQTSADDGSPNDAAAPAATPAELLARCRAAVPEELRDAPTVCMCAPNAQSIYDDTLYY